MAALANTSQYRLAYLQPPTVVRDLSSSAQSAGTRSRGPSNRSSNQLASHEMMVPRGDITAYGFAYVRVTYDATQTSQGRLGRKPQTTPTCQHDHV